MRALRFFFTLALAVALVVALDMRLGSYPPIGKFFDPFHGFWANAETAKPDFSKEVKIPGLEKPVKIFYDSLLIPHIFAQNDHDLYLAQGFITAQNRLWQMEFQTFAAAGRISEIVGAKALDYDRQKRREGLAYGARKAVQQMEKDSTILPLVEAYADGVNAYIKQLDYDHLPLEYKLLDYKPEKWTPLKTALLLKYMAADLAGRDEDFENTYLLKVLGEKRFNFLFPDNYDNKSPIIPKGTKWNFKPEVVKRPDSVHFPLHFPASEMEKPNPYNGSNNWAVSGSKTASGSPILASDPHLTLNLPSIWYVMQLHTPRVNTMGATLPGALGVIIGFNDSIAWGETNATRDVRDWYYIKFRNNSKREYWYDGKWLKTQQKVETFNVRGQEAYHDTIYYTHYGPVVYDNTFKSGSARENYALRWTAHDPSDEQMTFHLLNRAHNYNEYKKALTYFACPAQNFAFADNAGDIAIWVNGKFPLKWREQGKFLMDGTDPKYEWKGFIPRAQNAHVLNPPRGFISSANQDPVDSTYPYYVYDASYEHYRNQRINGQLSKMDHITPDDMMRLQNDNFNLIAFHSLPMMLDSLDGAQMNASQQKAYDYLKHWNFYNDPDKQAPAYYQVWWDKFYASLWDEFYDMPYPVRKPNIPFTINFMKKYWADSLVDNHETKQKESLTDLIRSSFSFAVDSVDRWKSVHEDEGSWAHFKDTYIQHLARLKAFSVSNVNNGGFTHIVNATSHRHGPSWRMIVELSDKVNAYGVYPGGQSGNPGSPYYDNLIKYWEQGKYYMMPFWTQEDQAKNLVLTQQLTVEN